MVGLVQMIVGVIVGIILVVAVAIPISISVIDTVNYATAETVAALIPLGLAVAALILAFQMVAGESG
jgi:hypothetical protein